MKSIIKKALGAAHNVYAKTRDMISRHTTEMHILGTGSAVIEGCLHIAEYDEEKIRLATKSGGICFFGQQLRLRFLDSEAIEISGKIGRIEFCSAD